MADTSSQRKFNKEPPPIKQNKNPIQLENQTGSARIGGGSDIDPRREPTVHQSGITPEMSAEEFKEQLKQLK